MPLTFLHLAASRGHAQHDWLDTYHTFSFADYYDPQRMGFGALRVLNDDTIAAGGGFSSHPHRDMEIVTIPLTGALAHKDSLGNSSVITAGEVQVMSAGTGVVHSEFNASQSEPVSLLQIWILPRAPGNSPRYAQARFEEAQRHNRWQTVVSGDGADGALMVRQSVCFRLAKLESGTKLDLPTLAPGRGIYFFVIEGEVKVAGQVLKRRDGLGLTDSKDGVITAASEAFILAIDVPYS